MKLQILSDLHTEFWGNPDISWLVPEEPVDVLVLAGDIGVEQNIEWVLKEFCAAYKQVVYVPGNHEYYNSSFKKIANIIGIAAIPGGSHSLSNNESLWPMIPHNRFQFGETSFIGGTLWFKDQPRNEEYKRLLNDFHLIKDFEPEVYNRNIGNVSFLENWLREGDIVVTHHCPSHKSTPEKYKDSELNRFFVCDMEELILERKPKLWIHGHTHGSCDYTIGATRVICNPFGYLGMEENPEFKEHLIVEV